MVLPDTLYDAAARFGDRVAIVPAPEHDEASLTYADLAGRVRATAAALSGHVAAGDVVVLDLPSTSSYLVAYLAAAHLGAITAGINPKLAAAEREALIEMVDPTVVLDDAERVRSWGDGDPRRAPTAVASDPESDVAVVFTSGTTGLPKGAVFTNRQLDAIRRIDVGDAVDGGGPILAATQFAHVGIMTKLNWYLRIGCTLVLVDRWRADRVLELVAEHRMSTIGGVAPQMALLVDVARRSDLDLSSVTSIVMGGAASPPALVRAARETFDATYSIRYSSTESGGCGLGTAFDAPEAEALHTVGRPRPGVEVAIRDADGANVPAGTVGEVCLRSDAVMDRYWNDPEATATTLVDGWLRTGDLGYVDDDGCVRLAGRAKEMYIRGGYNVYPMEVEAVLADHPAIREVCVLGVPDDTLGEKGCAVIVPAEPGIEVALDDLRVHLKDRLATYKWPESIRLVDALPRTAMDKIDRRRLAATSI